MKRYLVDRQALIHNIRLITQRAGSVTVWGVIKGNGYGLGVAPMARVLADNGITHFAITDLADARALRSAGFQQPILLMSVLNDPQELRELVELDVIATIGSRHAAQALEAVAQELGRAAQAHVKIDTGMGRYGFQPSELSQLHSVYTGCPNLRFTGIFTHFYQSSQATPTHAQFRRFQDVVASLKKMGIDVGMVHCCNSSAFWLYPEMHCDAVRVGSALLGRMTVDGETGLKRIGVCQAQLEEIRILPVGHSVGYGAGWTARNETETAVLSVGYANGFAVDRGYDLWRLLDCMRGVGRYVKAYLQRKRLYVRVNGQPCPVLGHVGMVNMVIDITHCDCKIGDWAEVDINPLLLKDMDVVFE